MAKKASVTPIAETTTSSRPAKPSALVDTCVVCCGELKKLPDACGALTTSTPAFTSRPGWTRIKV